MNKAELEKAFLAVRNEAILEESEKSKEFLVALETVERRFNEINDEGGSVLCHAIDSFTKALVRLREQRSHYKLQAAQTGIVAFTAGMTTCLKHSPEDEIPEESYSTWFDTCMNACSGVAKRNFIDALETGDIRREDLLGLVESSEELIEECKEDTDGERGLAPAIVLEGLQDAMTELQGRHDAAEEAEDETKH